MSSNKNPAPRKTRSSSSQARGRNSSDNLTGLLSRLLPARFKSTTITLGVAAVTAVSALLFGGSADELKRLIDRFLPGTPPAASAPASVPGQNYVQTQFAGCRQFFPNAELPRVPAQSRLRELCYDEFAILHSGQTRTPVFVAQKLNRRALQRGRNLERTDRFFADSRLPGTERAELDDYRRSGYSRGHMAPAADMSTPEGMAQSFSLANMVPQNQVHNGGAWSKIEQDTRKYVERAKGDVYVFTGPVYGSRPATIGDGRVAVPSHLYKLVYDPNTNCSWVFWQANSEKTAAERPISYADFVQRTGMHLLPEGAGSRARLACDFMRESS